MNIKPSLATRQQNLPEQFPMADDHGEHLPGKPWGDELALWYVDNYGEHPVNAFAIELADLKGSETLLDIGCGSGSAVRAAAEKNTTGRIIGLDPSPAMIRIAREQSQNHPASSRIEFIQSGAEDIPLAPESVDVAIAVNSLHHWPDMNEGLSEVARVLKQQGRLILIEEIFTEQDRGMRPGEVIELLKSSAFTLQEYSTRQCDDIQVNVFFAQPKEE